MGPVAAPHDYYELLGVTRDADAATIKEAFRKLALELHPDRSKDPNAEERFKEIAAAYAVLSSPERRRQYDTSGLAGMNGVSRDDLFRELDFADLLGGLGFGRGGAPFDHFFVRRAAGSPRGRDLEVVLVVPLERVAHGGDERVDVARAESCGACRGTGARDGSRQHPCEACQGSGRRVDEAKRPRGRGAVVVRSIRPCPSCDGHGRIIDERCPACDGAGVARRTEGLTVSVPVGIEEGMALRVVGRGEACDTPGGAAGDLLVVVRSAPDARFTRDGANLWRSEALSIPQAVLGCRRSVPTLDGTVDVKVPPATQPGSILRLAGKGLPELGGRARGDLLLRLMVKVPSQLGDEERALYERLRALESPPLGEERTDRRA